MIDFNWKKYLKRTDLIVDKLLINGEWIDSFVKTVVLNKADLQTVALMPQASLAQVNEAINTAQQAFVSWKKMPAKQRGALLRTWHNLILANFDDLATILTVESGKPFLEAQNEIRYATSFVEWFSEEARRIDGEIIQSNNPNQRILVSKEPVGVCAAITPWNFPSAMVTRKVAPALAAGCTVILRPSSQTPLSALALGLLALEAGIPAGVLNIITGNSEMISNTLTSSPIIRKISFTGSTSVGISLYQKSAMTLKKASLELGGNAPFIVFDDADIDKAINGLMQSKFRNAGQTCVCANRIFVHHNIKREFVNKLHIKMQDLNVGFGLDANIQVGPLINNQAVLHCESLLHDALNKGAKIIHGGTRVDSSNNFFMPTLLIDCAEDMQIFQEEIFAPIIAVYEFNSDDEVIALANNTPYGLASYFYSQNISRIYNVLESLEYGMVGINTGLTSGENVPFGGIKSSGFGREGGHEGIKEYTQIKYACLDIG